LVLSAIAGSGYVIQPVKGGVNQPPERAGD